MSTMRPLAIAALIVGFGLGTLPAALDGEWKKALGGGAVIAIVAVAGVIGYALGKATAHADQIVREEVDEPRRLAAELGDDPDPFALRRRVEYRTPPTDTTGETR